VQQPTSQTIPCQREAFRIPREIAYFNCAYLSPVLERVAAAVRVDESA